MSCKTRLLQLGLQPGALCRLTWSVALLLCTSLARRAAFGLGTLYWRYARQRLNHCSTRDKSGCPATTLICVKRYLASHDANCTISYSVSKVSHFNLVLRGLYDVFLYRVSCTVNTRRKGFFLLLYSGREHGSVYARNLYRQGASTHGSTIANERVRDFTLLMSSLGGRIRVTYDMYLKG